MDLPLEMLELSVIQAELKKKNLLRAPYLEVGCGDGFNMERFSKLGMRGVGIDASPEAVAVLRGKKLAGVEVLLGDFLTQEIFPRQATNIFMLNILEHLYEDTRFLAKAASLLPAGGYLIIATPAHQKAFGFADANAGHVRRYDKQELEEKLKSTGFVVDEWLTVGFPVNRFYTWVFNILNRRRSQTVDEGQTLRSGIRHKDGYYGGGFDGIAKVAFPLLSVAIQLDRLFVRTNLGNNFVVFAKKT